MTVKIVKSVGRVFKIWELFELKQRPMSVGEISNALNFPHSSTLMILKSMIELGYLINTSKHNYFPSSQVLSVFSWLFDNFEGEVGLKEFMSELHDLTGETINVSKRTGDYAKILDGHIGHHAITINVREGTIMPMNGSFVGLSILARLTDSEVFKILGGLQDQNIESSISTSDIMKIISDIRQKKIAAGYDHFIEGIGAITIPTKSAVTNETLVVGLIGPTNRVKKNEDEYIELIIKLAKKHYLEI